MTPFISFSLHGFGYDSVNDDYKIVTLSYFDTDNEHEPDFVDTFIDIYSAKMGSWKRLSPSPYDHAVPCNDSGTFLNGALHLLGSSCAYVNDSVISAFNLASEVFEELPPPATLHKDNFWLTSLWFLEDAFVWLMTIFLRSY